jgi:tRNA-binding protein
MYNLELPREIGMDVFDAIDLRTGTIVSARVHSKARKPAYVLTIDFGTELGVKTSSAQVCAKYQPEDLVGLQVIALVNIAPRKVADVVSACLVLGVAETDGVTLLTTQQPTQNGVRIS